MSCETKRRGVDRPPAPHRAGRPALRCALVGVLILISVALPGCAFSLEQRGPRPYFKELEKIVPGKSTLADVTRVLGPPNEVIFSNQEHDPLFERAFRYRYERLKRTVLFLIIFGTYRSDSSFDEIMILFDQAGVVEHVSSRKDTQNIRYGLP